MLCILSCLTSSQEWKPANIEYLDWSNLVFQYRKYKSIMNELFSGYWTFLKEKLRLFWRILWHAFMTCIRRGGNVLLWSRSNSFLLECFIAVEVWHVQRVVLLVTHEESASCFIRLQIILAKTCFWWKILSVQNILIVFICQNCTSKQNSLKECIIFSSG